MSNYKREMPFETRQKISNSLRGVKKSEHTKALIGQSVKKRWEEVPLTTSTSNSKNNE
jgi:hypothetical protein